MRYISELQSLRFFRTGLNSLKENLIVKGLVFSVIFSIGRPN